MNYDIKTLQYFKRTAELEHITKAADALFISQPQLSRIISGLEEQVGVKLFERSGKGIKLNAYGKMFYEYAQEIISISSMAEKKLREVYLHECAQISIVSNCGAYMPGIIGGLLEAMPDLKFRETEIPSGECIAALKDGTADFAICCPAIESMDIQTDLIYSESGAVIFPKGHWLEGRSSVSLFELENERFIGQLKGYGDRDSFDGECNRIGFSPNYIIETGEAFQLARLVAAGLGIALVPKSVLSHGSGELNYVEIEEELRGSVGLSWKVNRAFSDADTAFVDIISKYFSDTLA